MASFEEKYKHLQVQYHLEIEKRTADKYVINFI